MRTALALSIALVAVSFLLGAYVYPQMPEKVASHWDERGEVNGYMPRFWGVFFVPILSVVLLAIFLIIPAIDPLKANIQEFREYFDKFILLFFAFLLYVYILTLAWNLGFTFNMLALMAPAFGMLFYYLGVLVGHAKKNWSIGIRTPWTMSSEGVWEKTHKLGGKLFKLAGAIAIFGAVFQDYAIWLVLVPVLGVSAYLFVYSYLEFKKGGKLELNGKQEEKKMKTK
jgi:uncharacterized membrane protein